MRSGNDARLKGSSSLAPAAPPNKASPLPPLPAGSRGAGEGGGEGGGEGAGGAALWALSSSPLPSSWMKKRFPLFPPAPGGGGGPRAAAWGSSAAAGSRAGQGMWAASASGKSGLTPCPPPYVWPLWGLLRKRSGSKAGLGGAGGAEASEPTTTAKLTEGGGSAWGARCLVGVKPPVRCSSPARRRIAVPPLDGPPRAVGGLGLISRGSAKPEDEEDEEEEEDGEVCALGSSGGRGAMSGGGSGVWGWGTEVRVKARGSTLGEMMRCFVLLHLWVRLPEPAVEKGGRIMVGPFPAAATSFLALGPVGGVYYRLWPLGGRRGPHACPRPN